MDDSSISTHLDTLIRKEPQLNSIVPIQRLDVQTSSFSIIQLSSPLSLPFHS